MTNFAICEQGIVNAKIIPSRLFASPGACPPGVYHTLLWDYGRITAAEDRVRYFRSQLQQEGYSDKSGLNVIIDEVNIRQLVNQENLTNERAKLRLMVFDDAVPLANGQSTQVLGFVQKAVLPDYTVPFRCAVADRLRNNTPQSKWNIKRLGRTPVDMDLALAREQGFDDVLYLDQAGMWCEASYANLVAVFGKRVCLVTAPDLCYSGYTSFAISQLSDALPSLQIGFSELHARELSAADEVFLTSAIRGLQPVNAIAGIGTWSVKKSNSARHTIFEKLQALKIV